MNLTVGDEEVYVCGENEYGELGIGNNEFQKDFILSDFFKGQKIDLEFMTNKIPLPEIKDKLLNIIYEKSIKKLEILEKIKKIEKVEYKWRNFTEDSKKLKDYKKSKSFGAGAFGKIWISLKRDKEIVALKEMVCQTPDLTNMSILECSLAMKLDHPNILKYNDVFASIDEDEGMFKVFIEMEFYPLGDLSNFLLSHEIDEGLIIEFCKQIIDGIEYIHSKDMIHRDLKPANILIKVTEKDNFQLAICDFGASKNVVSMKIGSLAGTETYAAPEMMEKFDLCTEKVDIFAFGVIVYFFITLKERKFYLELLKNEESLKKEIKNEIIDKKLVNQDVFIQIILSCIDKDPSKRPSIKDLKKFFEK